MSHFCVLVVGADVDKQLAPFQENNMGTCPQEFLEFQDREEETRHTWETGSKLCEVLPDGQFLSVRSSAFRERNPNFEVPAVLPQQAEGALVPSGPLLREVPLKEMFPDFGDFAKRYCGLSFDEDSGHHGFWENPQAKWDWYEVGGRYANFFKIKRPASEGRWRPGFLERALALQGADRASKCLWGDVDYAGMRAEARIKAENLYDKVCEVLAGRTVTPFSVFREAFAEDDQDKARAEFWAQPVMQDLSAARLQHVYQGVLSTSRDDYVRNAEASALTPYAILKNGTWYARGQCGMFGVSTGEMSESDWNQEVFKILATLSPDDPVCIVDCHI